MSHLEDDFDDALLEMGEHEEDCPAYWDPFAHCTCGYDEG